MGNRLRHAYDHVDPGIVWQVVNNRLPELKADATAALRKVAKTGGDRLKQAARRAAQSSLRAQSSGMERGAQHPPPEAADSDLATTLVATAFPAPPNPTRGRRTRRSPRAPGRSGSARPGRAACSRCSCAAPRPAARRGDRRTHRPAARPTSSGSPAPACPSVRSMLATVQRTQGCAGSVRLAGMRTPAFSMRTPGNPSASRWRRSAALEAVGIGVHRVADLAMRARVRRHRVDRVLRPARDHRQHDETVPAVDLLGRGQARLAPVRVDRWPPRRRRRPGSRPAPRARSPARRSAAASRAPGFSPAGR